MRFEDGQAYLEHLLETRPELRRYPKEEVARVAAETVAKRVKAAHPWVDEHTIEDKYRTWMLPPRGWERTAHVFAKETQASLERELGSTSTALAKLLEKAPNKWTVRAGHLFEQVGRDLLRKAYEAEPLLPDKAPKTIGALVGSTLPWMVFPESGAIGAGKLASTLLRARKVTPEVMSITVPIARALGFAAGDVEKERLLNEVRQVKKSPTELATMGFQDLLFGGLTQTVSGRLKGALVGVMINGTTGFISTHDLSQTIIDSGLGAIIGALHAKPSTKPEPRPPVSLLFQRPEKPTPAPPPIPETKPSPAKTPPIPEVIQPKPTLRLTEPKIGPTSQILQRVEEAKELLKNGKQDEAIQKAQEAFSQLTPEQKEAAIEHVDVYRGVTHSEVEKPRSPDLGTVLNKVSKLIDTFSEKERPLTDKQLSSLLNRKFKDLDPTVRKSLQDSLASHGIITKIDQGWISTEKALDPELIENATKKALSTHAPIPTSKPKPTKPVTEAAPAPPPPQPESRYEKLHSALYNMLSDLGKKHPHDIFSDKILDEAYKTHFPDISQEERDAIHRALENEGLITFRRKGWELSERAFDKDTLPITLQRVVGKAGIVAPSKVKGTIHDLVTVLQDSHTKGISLSKLRQTAKDLNIPDKAVDSLVDDLTRYKLVKVQGKRITFNYPVSVTVQKMTELGIYPSQYDTFYTMVVPIPASSARKLADAGRQAQKFFHTVTRFIIPTFDSPKAQEVFQRWVGLKASMLDEVQAFRDKHYVQRLLYFEENPETSKRVIEWLEKTPEERAKDLPKLTPDEQAIGLYYEAFFDKMREELRKLNRYYDDWGYVFHAVKGPKTDPWDWINDPNFHPSDPRYKRTFRTLKEGMEAYPDLEWDTNLESIAFKTFNKAQILLNRDKALEQLEKVGWAKKASEVTTPEEQRLFVKDVMAPNFTPYKLTNEGYLLYSRVWFPLDLKPMSNWLLRTAWGFKHLSLAVPFGLWTSGLAHALHLGVNVLADAITRPQELFSRVTLTRLANKYPEILKYFEGEIPYDKLSPATQQQIQLLHATGVRVLPRHTGQVLLDMGEVVDNELGERMRGLHTRWIGALEKLGLLDVHHLIFSRWIPLLKIQETLDYWEHAFRNNPMMAWDSPEFLRTAQTISRSIIDRYGQADWETHMSVYEPLLARAFGATVVSLGWIISSARRMLGYPVRLSGWVAKAARGEKLNPAEAKALVGDTAYIMLTLGAPALWNWMKTGRMPEDVDDFISFRIHENEDGSWVRYWPIFFSKEGSHIAKAFTEGPEALFRFAYGKAHPGIHLLVDIVRGKDMWNREIVTIFNRPIVDGRQVSLFEAGAETLERTFETLGVPAPAQTLLEIQRHGTPMSPELVLPSLIGLRASAGFTWDSPLERDISQLARKRGIIFTVEDQRKRLAERQLRDAYASGDEAKVTQILSRYPELQDPEKVMPKTKQDILLKRWKALPKGDQVFILTKYGITPQTEWLWQEAHEAAREEAGTRLIERR